MNKEDCLTKQNILDWIKIQDDGAVFCPHCLSVMRPYGANTFLRCKNKMCLFEIGVLNADHEEIERIEKEIEQERGREVLEEMKTKNNDEPIPTPEDLIRQQQENNPPF